MINIEISDKVFNSIYLKHAMNNNKRYQLYYGGSSSGKSYAIAQRTIIDILQGDRNYLVVRQYQNTVKKSIFNELVKAISRFKVSEFFSINKSELTITCNVNKKQILFSGLDDPEKIKSVTPIDGVITDILIEEATEIEYAGYKQLSKRLRGKSKAEKRITLLFNPILKDHWIYKEFFGIWEDNKQYAEDETTSILKTTYKDNKFLTEDDIRGLEDETDKYYYEVYTLGNWGVLGAVIFKNWKTEDLTDMIPTFDNIYNGLDWGFADDPLAFVKLHYDKMRKKIYIYDELYVTGMLNSEIAPTIRIKTMNEMVTADSAEPKSIEEFRRTYKINIKGAKKGKGSIESGIKFIQDNEVIIHSKCTNTRMEFSKYKYKEDKNGNVIPKPVDKDNHIIDALRYALESVNTNASWGWKN